MATEIGSTRQKMRLHTLSLHIDKRIEVDQ
jgi:hypothetical protein